MRTLGTALKRLIRSAPRPAEEPSYDSQVRSAVDDYFRRERERAAFVHGDADAVLDATFLGDRPPRHASSFRDEEEAEHVIGEVIDLNSDEIAAWLETGRPWLMVESTFDRTTGIATEGDDVVEVSGVRLVLARAADRPEGFRVHNGYPQRARTPRLDLPALRHLAGAYFHQEWVEDHGSYPELVYAFADQSPDLALRLLEELPLCRLLSEQELDALFDQLGCELTLASDETWHLWLNDVEWRVRDALGLDER